MSVAPTPELTALGLAAILQAGQIGLAAWSMNRDGLSRWNAGPRDAEPDFSPLTARLRRAVDNHFEALVFFIIAVVLVEFTLSNNLLTAICAWIYLGARVLYVDPELDEALAAGITTVGGGGTGPAEGSKATTCTPGRIRSRHSRMFLGLPLRTRKM